MGNQRERGCEVYGKREKEGEKQDSEGDGKREKWVKLRNIS